MQDLPVQTDGPATCGRGEVHVREGASPRKGFGLPGLPPVDGPPATETDPPARARVDEVQFGRPVRAE